MFFMLSLLHYKTYQKISKTNHCINFINNPPLFILHGLLGSMDNWHTQAKRLQQFRTVITIDLRNHGRSPHLKGMSYQQMGLDILAIMEYEKLKTIDVLGHSMGGKVAMWLALHYPRRITTLIVVDMAPKTYPLWHQKMLIAMLKAPLLAFQSRQQVDHYLSQFIADNSKRSFISKNLQKRTGRGYKWRCNLKEIVTSYLKIATFPVPTSIFSNQSYFIRGENSPYILPTDHALIKRLFIHAEIHTIKNSSHLPHVEQADDFYQLLKSFLK